MLANIVTIDVEEWYHTNGWDLPVKDWSRFEDRVVANTERILDLFDQLNMKATFFILGCVAMKHPQLVREISARGHEIGSHGGWHRLVSRMSEEEFRADIRISKETLEHIIGEPVLGFRAPSWSIGEDQFHYLEILEEEGYAYDSSLQPFRTPLSGSREIPVMPFRPVINGRALRLIEVPATVFELSKLRVPFSGGFYLRFWPSWFTRWAFRQISSSNRPAMLYTHPWEMDLQPVRVPVPFYLRLMLYYNLHSNYSKVKKVLQDQSFSPVRRFMQECTEFPLYALPDQKERDH